MTATGCWFLVHSFALRPTAVLLKYVAILALSCLTDNLSRSRISVRFLPLYSIAVFRCWQEDTIELDYSLFRDTGDFGSREITGQPYKKNNENQYDCFTPCELHDYSQYQLAFDRRRPVVIDLPEIQSLALTRPR